MQISRDGACELLDSAVASTNKPKAASMEKEDNLQVPFKLLTRMLVSLLLLAAPG